ncbi:MAG: NUDIX domain-containing protein [Symbiobacteriaceae bacterium]|nr:NUDIX domain-containing protein [Symbiobacteriaceae bacterium]
MRGIIFMDEKLLVIQRRGEIWRGVRFYEFPGGGIEAGESHADALIREIWEETGFRINPGSIRAFGEVREIRQDLFENAVFDQPSYYYLAEAESNQNVHFSEESDEWEGRQAMLVSLEDALALNSQSASRVITDFLYREVFIMQLLSCGYK